MSSVAVATTLEAALSAHGETASMIALHCPTDDAAGRVAGAVERSSKPTEGEPEAVLRVGSR
jgi:hypothetical protein